MAPFILDSTRDHHYIGCVGGGQGVVSGGFPNRLVVYKLMKKSETIVFESDWNTVTIIDPARPNGFNSLVVNNFPVNLAALSQDIAKHRLVFVSLHYIYITNFSFIRTKSV